LPLLRSRDLDYKLATLLEWRETRARDLSGEPIWRTPEGTSTTANWTRDAHRAHQLLERFDLSIDRQSGGVLVAHGDIRAFAAYHEHRCPDEALQHAIVVAAVTKLTAEQVLSPSSKQPCPSLGRM
jgi:hypothetical protein